MSPAAKFNALIATATVFVMFWAVTYASPFLKAVGVNHPSLQSLATLIGSVGVYNLLSQGVRCLMAKWNLVSRTILGAHYMHGTWVGYFIGHAGDKRYAAEHYSQNLDSLVISGRSYDDKGTLHGLWTSESVTIDAKKGVMTFTYLFEVISRSSSLTGVNTSLFQRKSAEDPPTGITGFAHDLNDPTRIAFHSEKASEDFLPWSDALREAQRRFGHIPANKEMPPIATTAALTQFLSGGSSISDPQPKRLAVLIAGMIGVGFGLGIIARGRKK